MASESKEDSVLKIILENSPLKEWHFEEIVKEANITKAAANKWLKKYVAQGLLKHKKEKGRFPYFTVGSNNQAYYSMKRIYALEQLHKSGLLARLLSMDNAKTIIIFGSMINGDWYKDSDIDIFIMGDVKDLNKTEFELKLKKNIEIHKFIDRKEITGINTGLIKNVINGYIIKGQIQDIVEVKT